jgi:alpha-tubulin suppressor-like RCC1 family protein
MGRIGLVALCASTALALAATIATAGPASATSDGVFAWGANSYAGPLGIGSESGPACNDPAYRCVYAPVATLNLGEAHGNSVAEVAGGEYRSIALLTGGSVMTWGESMGSGSAVYDPVPVSGLSNAIAIAAGDSHDLALLENGTVMAWGRNTFGELGTGDYVAREAPTPVAGLTGVVAIAAKGHHSLALKNDGTVWAWGDNAHGQLGDGTSENSNVPVEVVTAASEPLAGITAIAAGGQGTVGIEHSLALNASGEVFAWGDGEYGQLGTGEKPQTVSHAVPVTGLRGAVSAIAAGGRQSMALLATEKVMTWGWNAHGELGAGRPPTKKRLSDKPLNVTSLAPVKAITAGTYFDVALLQDGTVATWGFNEFDELGNEALNIPGTNTTAHFSDVPVAVTRLHGVVGIGAGYYHALAIAPANGME